MEKNIVLIDNNFAIRETLKIVLDSLTQNNQFKFNIFSSQNGIEGLGFVYVTQPDLVILDTTLPKYNGNDLLYFLLTNKKFHTEKIKVIILTEKKQTLRVPQNFSVINKSDKNLLKKLSKEVETYFRLEKENIYEYPTLIPIIINVANKSDVIKTKFEKQNLLQKFLLVPKILLLELAVSLLLVFTYQFHKRIEDSNIKQEKRNLSLLRRRHYPTAIVGTLAFIIATILLVGVIYTQNIFIDQNTEQTSAYGYGEIGWYSNMDSESDVTNPITGSAGSVLNGADFVTQSIEDGDEEFYEIKSARFNADTEVIRIANPVLGQDVGLDKGTVEFLYNPLESHTADKEMTFFNIYADANNKIEFKKLNDVNDSLSLVYKCTDCSDAEVLVDGSDYVFNADEWVQFTVKWNAYAPLNDQLKIIVDGDEPTQTRNNVSMDHVSISDPTYIHIGNSSAAGTNEANGLIDEFFIYLDIDQPEATPVGTPAPTPVYSQNSGEPSWYSDFDSTNSVYNPAFGESPGVFSGATFIDGPAEHGNALYFEATGKSLYIEAQNGLEYSLNEGAVEFYYRPLFEANHNTEMTLFNIRFDDDEQIRFFKKDNSGSNDLTLAFSCQSNCGGEETIAYADYNVYWDVGEWMFFRVTWNDNSQINISEQLKIYINGDQPSHTDQEFMILGDSISTSPSEPIVYVGNKTEDGNEVALGSIDEFKILLSTVVPTVTITPIPSPTLSPTITVTPSITPTNTPTPIWYSTMDDENSLLNPVNGTGADEIGTVSYVDGVIDEATRFDNDEEFVKVVLQANDFDEVKGRITFKYKPIQYHQNGKSQVFFSIRSTAQNISHFRFLKDKENRLELSYEHDVEGAANENFLFVDPLDYTWQPGQWIDFEIFYDTTQTDPERELRLFMDGVELNKTHENLSRNISIPMSAPTLFFIGNHLTSANAHHAPALGAIDEFRLYNYFVDIPYPTEPEVSPTPTEAPSMNLLWYSTLDNDSSVTSPVVGTGLTPASMVYTTLAGRVGADFTNSGGCISGSPTTTDYYIPKGEIEFYFNPSVNYNTGYSGTLFQLRHGPSGKTINIHHGTNNALNAVYDSNSGRTVRILGSDYAQYWTVGQWMKINVQWDGTDPNIPESERLRFFINDIEPTHTDLGTLDVNTQVHFLSYTIGTIQGCTQRARGLIDDVKIFGIGVGISPTPTPTPVSLTDADPIWYSTMENASALTTPVIGKGATSQNVTFESAVNGNGVRIDAPSEHVTVGAIPYTTPPVSFKKDKGAIEFYYKPDLASDAAQTITLFNVRVNDSNQLKLFKQSGANPLWLNYVHGGTTRSIQIPNATFATFWKQSVWMKVRIEWDRTKSSPDHLKIFLDNVRPTVTPVGGVFSDFTGDPTLYIGNVTNTGSEQAMGVIDDFTIFGDPDTRSYKVDSTGDESDANIGDFNCATSSGSCTLRAAIEEANNSTAADRVVFEIEGSGPHIITPASALPSITNVLEIDGTSQSGANCTTKDLRIVLSGGNLNASGISFSNTTSGNVKGLVIYGFREGIHYTNSTGGEITCNIIGLSQDGVAPQANSQAGIEFENSSDSNTVGGSNAGEGNIISSNINGILIDTSDSIVIQGNYIGTDKGGTLPRGNTEKGISITSSTGTIIGDSSATEIPATCTGSCNIISNNSNGIDFESGTSTSSNSTIKANFIGSDVNGTSAIRNTNGIEFTKVSNLNIAYNILTASTRMIHGLSSSDNSNAIADLTIDNNYLGVNRSATAKLADSSFGVWLQSNTSSTLDNVTITNNTIGAAVNSAIFLYGSEISDAVIKSNYIGFTEGDVSISNKYGIQLFNTDNASIDIGGSNEADGNVISTNRNHAIYLYNAKKTLIQNNTIHSNLSDGVYISQNASVDNTIVENSIFNNTGLGINLVSPGPKINYNDDGDTDTGPNNLQNFPIIIKAIYEGTTLTLHYAYQSDSSKYYRLDFYSNDSSDPSGFGEGDYHFHTINGVQTNPIWDKTTDPLVLTSLTLPANHKYISATATECGEQACTNLYSTSEFGLTGFDGGVIGKGLDLDTSSSSLPRLYVAADGDEYIPDLYALDVLIDDSLDIATGINTNNQSTLGIVGLDANNFASAGYSATNQYQVYNILNGYQCGYSVGSDIKAMDIKIAKNGVSSKYVYMSTNSNNEELVVMQGEAVDNLSKFGEYLSEVKDMGTPIKSYHSIVWTEEKNNGELKLQIRTGDSSNLTNEEWYGPDGTRSTYFVLESGNEGEPLPKVIQGKRYIQYRVLMESDQLVSPALNSITIRYGD